MIEDSYSVRKNEIMTRAAELFREKGYQSTSVNDIASEMGFSKPALYYYFKNKTEILWEIYNVAMNRARGEALRLSAESLTCTEKLRRMLMTHVQLVCEELPFWSVMFDEENSLAEEQQRVIRTHRREYAGIFERVYAEGVVAGEFRDCPPHIAVSAILGAYNWLYKWYQPDEEPSPDEIFRYYYDILASGFIISAPRQGATAR